MKKESKKTKFIIKKIKGIKFDVRTEGSCYVTMQTNAGELTVYIDAMDGLTDSPFVRGWIDGRKDKSFQVKPNKKATKKEDENVLNAIADLGTADIMGLIEKGKNKKAIIVGVKMGLTKKDVEKTIKDYGKATKEG